MVTPVLWGNPFGTTTTAGRQRSTETVTFADGSFVAVWGDKSETGSDLSGSAIRAQLYNADGSKRGVEFVVNTTTDSDQSEPDIALLGDGRFVVTWEDRNLGIRARIFNADGTAYNRGGDSGTADFQVNIGPKGGGQGKPSVAALANGGFVIVFNDNRSGDHDIKAQAFNAQGFQSGAETLINTVTAGDQINANVVSSGNSYTVFYESTNDVASVIKSRTFYTDGRGPSSEALVSHPDFINSFAKTTKLSDGRILVTWGKYIVEDDAVSYSSHAKIYKADGSGTSIELNLNVSDAPYSIISDVTALPDGGFAIAHFSFKDAKFTASSTLDVGVTFYDAQGNKTGTHAKLQQLPLSILDSVGTDFIGLSTLADGRVIVTSASIDGAKDINVLGQIMDGRTTGVSLSGTANNDEYYGSDFNDSLGGAAGNDKLVGGAGNDTLIGGAGRDTLDGGAGDDTYDYDPEDTIIDTGGRDTLIVSSHYTLSNASAMENLTASGSAALKLTGNSGSNKLTGNAAANTLTGGSGNDTLDGAGGADRMVGGTGNDTYYVNHRSDKVIETSSRHGSDTVYSSISYTLGNYVEKLIGAGTGKINLSGNASSNTITGNDGRNVLKGHGGNDTIDGKLGNDTLYGGAGRDKFVFSTALNSRSNIDRIVDFNVNDDTIRLENAIFTKLTKTGTLSRSFFKVGAQAGDSNDYIVYNKQTGVLSYDADGSGQGAAVKFAKVDANLDLTYRDFFVI
jgi:Ca2+-binding RTX toxin-like protein